MIARLFFWRKPMTARQAASRLSQEGHALARARRIAKMNELRAELSMPPFVPGGRHG